MSKKKKENKLVNKSKGLVAEFTKFISRGNVIDMAVGVIVGGAFSAIITAVINGILMPLITSAIPSGSIDGLVTVLNPSSWVASAAVVESGTYTAPEGIELIRYWNDYYDAAKVAVINWGTVINAIIYFLSVALILFVILKVVAFIKDKKAAMAAKIQEEYYKKHPEERPVVEEAKPVEVKPTEVELLTEILNEIKANKESK